MDESRKQRNTRTHTHAHTHTHKLVRELVNLNKFSHENASMMMIHCLFYIINDTFVNHDTFKASNNYTITDKY